MTIEQLSDIETELISILTDINKMEQTPELNRKLESVFDTYRQVHQSYAELAEKDNEALKRGLFIQWYACTEPSYLTGISSLDAHSEEKIIEQIESRLSKEPIDEELNWMLNYFGNWGFVFERFKKYKKFSELLSNKTDVHFPISIDSAAMNKRGQMGSYWNSLTRLWG